MMDAFICRRGGSSSGGSGFTWITGERPESADANTIWVQTDTEIGSAYITNSQPSGAAAGDVWLYLHFNRVYVYQYISGTWTVKNAEIYDGSSWGELSLAYLNLFYNGDQNIDITGGWKMASSLSTASLSWSPDISGSIRNSQTIIYTASKVDITDYSTLKFVGSMNIGTATQVGAASAISTSGHTATFAASATGAFSANQTVDVSGLSGSYYIVVYFRNTGTETIDISRIYLE